VHDEIQATFVSVLVKLSIIGFEVSVVTFFMRRDFLGLCSDSLELARMCGRQFNDVGKRLHGHQSRIEVEGRAGVDARRVDDFEAIVGRDTQNGLTRAGVQARAE